MAGLSAARALLVSHESREQFAAIAQLRWRIFVNSLRTLRGRLEAVSWILVAIPFIAMGIGGTIGLAVASWFFTSHNVAWVTLLLWGVFLYWQLFPLMATAFTENFDLSNFLRFPIRYRSYFLIRMAYGVLDPTTLIGTLWLIGITIGISMADPRLFPWAALALGTFAVLNILLARAIFSWIERWLARRKSREILGIVFFLFIISFQFIGPVLNHYGNRGASHTHPVLPGVTAALLPAERFTPPGLAGGALAAASHGETPTALGSWVLECGYAAIFLWMLDLRLRAQYHGESLGEGVPRAATSAKKIAVREGLDLPGFSTPVAAVFEKELRYLSRSGPMLFNLVMPLVILIIFMIGPVGNARHPHAMHDASHFRQFAFPMGVAYALLILSNLTYNCFGVEGGGIQFYFVAPVRFRQILLAKNLVHGAIVALEVALLWTTVSLMLRPPALDITLATVAGAVFAALVNFTAGDLMSLYSPKKFDYAVFGRQRASGTTALVVLGVQIVVIGIAALVLLFTAYSGRIWLATPILLVFAGAAFAGYTIVLNHVDRVALGRRESLIVELSRAQ